MKVYVLLVFTIKIFFYRLVYSSVVYLFKKMKRSWRLYVLILLSAPPVVFSLLCGLRNWI